MIYDILLYSNLTLLNIEQGVRTNLLSSLSLLSITTLSRTPCTNPFLLQAIPLTAGFKGKPKSAIQGERNVGCKESGR